MKNSDEAGARCQLLASYLRSELSQGVSAEMRERLRSVMASDAVASIMTTREAVHELRLAMERIDARAAQERAST